MIGILLFLFVVVLDAWLVTPWLSSLREATPGVEQAWLNFLIPIATTLIGKMAGGKRGGGGGYESDGDPRWQTGGDGGGGFNWGAAAPYLAGGAGLAAGALLGRRGRQPAQRTSPLDELLAFQSARLKSAEPLQQALLAARTSMLPTHLRAPGTAAGGWLDDHDAATHRAFLDRGGSLASLPPARRAAMRRGA